MQLSGALTFATAAALWAEHSPRAAGERQLDVSAVSQVDSAGLALITALRRAAGPQCGLTGVTAEILALAKAYDILPLFEPETV